MANSSDIGANFSDYTGNAALGGSSIGVINIDTKPLEQLAAYTFHYNKSVWEQQQKDADEMIANLAKLHEINPNSLHGKDKEEMLKQMAQAESDAADLASQDPAKTPQERIQRQLDWQKKLSTIENNWTTTKQRTLSYQSQINDINGDLTTSADQKAEMIKQINDHFDSTDISTPLQGFSKYTPKVVNVPDAPVTEVNTVAIGGDQNIATKASLFNWTVAPNLASASVFDLTKRSIPKTIKDKSGKEIVNPEYAKLSPSAKEENDQQSAVPSDVKDAADIDDAFNSALNAVDKTTGKPLYYDQDGNFLASKFESDNASNTTIMRPYNALKSMNDGATNELSQAAQGVFTDKGVQYKLPSNFDANSIKAGLVDFNKKGVTKEQLIQAAMYAKYKGDQVTKTVTETGKAMQLKIARENRASMERINAANIAKDKYIANLPYEKAKKGAIGADGVTPIDFGNLIYGVKTPANKTHTLFSPDGSVVLKTPDGKELKEVKINNGVVVDKNGNVLDYTGDVRLPATIFDNSMVTEFNRYAGTSKLAADGSTVLAASKLVPIDNQFTVRMQNGEIQGVQADDGTFITAQQMQHITLEAGQKGATKYKKPDTEYGKFDTQPPKASSGGMTDEEYNNFLKKNGLK